ncbi:MAG: tetratricopeptide repeat protein [Myxococcales bacterium]
MTTGLELLDVSDQAFASKDFAAAIEHARAALAAGLDRDVPGSERGEYWAHPETARAELVIGMALLELGEREQALAHLDRAIALDRENKRVWANRGHVRRERGELELALADFDHALSRDSEYAYARLRRAQTLLDLSRRAEAEADLERILTLNPYDTAPFGLWQTLRSERGLATDLGALPAPQDPAGLFRRAWLFIEHAEPERGLRDLNGAYALSPQPYLLASLAHTHALLGNLSEARASAEGYLATDPSHAGMRSLLNDLIQRQEKAEPVPE